MRKKSNYERVLSKAIREIDKGQLSNIIFDGKGEIELNRRLSYRLCELGVPARVEHHFRLNETRRVRPDIIIFDEIGKIKAFIECKACITPDVYQTIGKKPTHHLFSDLRKDVTKYDDQKKILVFAVMWASHWKLFDREEGLRHRQIKYFRHHRSMHFRGFNLKRIEQKILCSFVSNGLREPFCQVVLDDPSCWLGCKAQVIATISRAR